MPVIDGLKAAQEAAAGSPTLVGGGVRSANAMHAVHVLEDDIAAARGRRRTLYLTFVAGATIGAVVFAALSAIKPQAKTTAEDWVAPKSALTASSKAAVTRAAPLSPSGSLDEPQVGLLVDAERILQARGVRVTAIDSSEARYLRLAQGPQAFRVAKVAAGVTSVAPDDIIVGSCGSAPDAAGRLGVCVVRDGKLVVAHL